MMRQVFLASVACGFLAACATEVPNSARPQGVGFADYEDYQATREGTLSGPVVTTRPIGGPPAVTTIPDATAPVGQQVAAAAPARNNPGISDEQNFDAVSSRETIESDAARLERQRQAYQQVAPEALPERSGDLGPNIVAYALQTSNSVGQPVYDRGRVTERRYERACAEYATADQAQEAFLAAGGPERDRKDLDPDGDGFACGWNPAPFRVAQR
ncbi:MAG: hypothetical protein AAGA87_14225 [Pseudomonadota bacterium]